MGKSRRISINTLGVLIGLELSVLWILISYGKSHIQKYYDKLVG
jgi:hypothetical protein